MQNKAEISARIPMSQNSFANIKELRIFTVFCAVLNIKARQKKGHQSHFKALDISAAL